MQDSGRVPQVQGRHSCRQVWEGWGLAHHPGARAAGPLQGPKAWGGALEAISHSQVGTAAWQPACDSKPGGDEGVRGNGSGGVAEGSAVGFGEEQDSCKHTRHWWQRSQLLELAWTLLAVCYGPREVSTDLPSSDYRYDRFHQANDF